MAMTCIEPYRPPRPTIRELIEGRPAGEDEGGVAPKGCLGRPPRSIYRLEDRAEVPEARESAQDTAMARERPAASTRNTRTTLRGRAGDRGEGRVERREGRLTYNNVGLNGWVAREGRPPGMAGDHQGPRHRMAVRLDESTKRKRDRC